MSNGLELTVLLPGLGGPDDPGAGDAREAARLLTEGMQLPALTRLLGRSRPAAPALASATLDGMLFEAFAVPPGPHGDWPAGAVSRQGLVGDAGSGVWLRADPVHLRADMGKLILFPPRFLGLSLDEAARIARWLNGHEHTPGPAVEPASACCWHARIERLPRMRTVPPSQAHGWDADASLPRGPDAAQWHARMNELQMLLHQCPVNAERETRGAPAANSLWFWGAGALPERAGGGYACAWGEHELLAGLAGTAGIAARPLPGGAEAWLGRAAPGTHLLALDALALPASAADMGAWCATLLELEHSWFAPLALALRAGRVRRVDLHAGRGAGARVTRQGLRSWWRRTPPLAPSLAALRRWRTT